MSSANDAWKIPLAAELCAGCEQPLEPDARYTAVIRFGDEGPERSDWCEACGQGVDFGDAIFWRARRTEDSQRRAVVDYTMLREVFDQLVTRDDLLSRRLAYVVGLVLVRKRFLRLKGFERRGQREVMIVTRGKDHPDVEAPAPVLSGEDLVEVREHLARLMRAELSELDVPPRESAAD